MKKALDELGPDRMLFATDWPYKYVGSEIVKFDYYNLSIEDRDKIFRQNALKLWKL